MVVQFRGHLVGAVAMTVFMIAIGLVPRAEAAPPMCFEAAATIVGTEGDDVLTGTPGPDVIVGLGGADTIRGKDGDDKICGGDGDDLVSGGDGIDSVDGDAGADDLRLGPNPFRDSRRRARLLLRDQEYGAGGAGDDLIDAGSGNDSRRRAGDDRMAVPVTTRSGRR